MRLWHKGLLQVLPRQQLCSQWRECCCIAKNLSIKSTPNHILVNKILNYPIQDFIQYSYMVRDEMIKRNYKISNNAMHNFQDNMLKCCGSYSYDSSLTEIFKGWHNERYLVQCLLNLQEKYDCGGITEDEWKIINDDNWMYLDDDIIINNLGR